MDQLDNMILEQTIGQTPNVPTNELTIESQKQQEPIKKKVTQKQLNEPMSV